MYLLVRLFIFIRLGCLGTGFVIDRPSNGAGDLFSKMLYDGTNPIRISSCANDVRGRGGAYDSNPTGCSCTWGQTFVLDGRTPKCMKEYGQDKKDLECKFHITGQNKVKVLTPALLTSSASIGKVSYKSSAVSDHEITDLLYWNMTWIRPTESDLFSFSNEFLKWTSINPAGLARKYSGLLFKLELSGKESGSNWKFSCLLLKFSGSRNYPSPALQQSSSTPSPRITSSTSLSPSSQISMSNTKTASSSKSSVSPTSSPTSSPNGNVGKQKEKGSNVAKIAGIVVGIIAAAFALVMVIFLCRRKYPSKNRKRRRETLMLNLTANSFSNENPLGPTASLNATKKTLDNPVYDNKLILQKPGNNLAAGAYENRGLPTSDPIYKDIEAETPVYQETGGMYEPLSKNNKPVSESEHYQPIDVSTLPRTAQPLQSPIYQVLDDGAEEEPRAQSPVYQTVEQDAYQAIDHSGAQNGDAFYAQLDSDTLQPPLQEPLYRELDIYANGHLNVKYEDDEGAI